MSRANINPLQKEGKKIKEKSLSNRSFQKSNSDLHKLSRHSWQKVEIDEKLLKVIADKTGGLYFRATDNSSLESIYNEINKLEKTEINEFKYYNYNEKYRIFVLIALIVIFTEWLLKNTLYKSFI